MTDAPQPTSYAWTLTDHICRSCMGRVIKRPGIGPRRYYRCTNCGTEVEGTTTAALCCCGMKLRTGRDAGVRCARNTEPSPECQSEIIAQPVILPPVLPVIDEDEV